jgi:uncharacterized protein YaiL (DUF2058 family)
MKSLKDQLLKAGLTDQQSVRNARKQRQKTPTKPKSKRGQDSQISREVESLKTEKANKDRELNRLREQTAQQKAALVQVKQLIDSSALDREGGELAYNFNHGSKIKKIYVNQNQQRQLSKGQIAIVTYTEDAYKLVPRVVAKKIAVQYPDFMIQHVEEAEQAAADDPYADYQIPDDLVW